jgi:hypothetical protein
MVVPWRTLVKRSIDALQNNTVRGESEVVSAALFSGSVYTDVGLHQKAIRQSSLELEETPRGSLLLTQIKSQEDLEQFTIGSDRDLGGLSTANLTLDAEGKGGLYNERGREGKNLDA